MGPPVYKYEARKTLTKKEFKGQGIPLEDYSLS